MQLAEFVQSPIYAYICYGVITIAVLLGIVALFHPGTFERLCMSCRHWVDTPMRFKKLDDYVIDTDALALKNTRLTGLIFIAMSVVLAFASGIL